MAVSAAHVVEGASDVEVTVVANAAGDSEYLGMSVDLANIATFDGGSPDICLMNVSHLEDRLVEGALLDNPLHIELSPNVQTLEPDEYQFCSMIGEGYDARVEVFSGSTGLLPNDSEVRARLHIEESGEVVFIASPPNGASGSPVFAIHGGEVSLVGALAGRCSPIGFESAGLATIVSTSTLADLLLSSAKVGRMGKPDDMRALVKVLGTSRRGLMIP